MAVRTTLIVGAGPVGCITALALAQHGVSVTVIEQGGSETPPHWKGSTIHPPTLELLDTLGIADAMVGQGVHVPLLEYRDTELDTVAAFDYALLNDYTPYPFRLQFEQYKLLGLVRARCEASSVIEVRYHHALVGLQAVDSPAPVALVAGPGKAEPQALSADLIVGADGARSPVRKALGIEYEGMTYPTLNAVIATDYDLATLREGMGPVSYWTSPEGKASVICTPDHWRVGLALPPDVDGDDEAAVSDFARERLHAILGLPLDLAFNQAAGYHAHQRLASRLRHGRVCLVGDAAHANSPTGGLGLNSGIHDAFDLAARVQDDDLGAALDQYARVRATVARRVVQEISGRNAARAATRDYASREAQQRQLAAQAADPRTATDYLLSASMLAGARAFPPGFARATA